jgi:hypothetical protein
MRLMVFIWVFGIIEAGLRWWQTEYRVFGVKSGWAGSLGAGEGGLYIGVIRGFRLAENDDKMVAPEETMMTVISD